MMMTNLKRSVIGIKEGSIYFKRTVSTRIVYNSVMLVLLSEYLLSSHTAICVQNLLFIDTSQGQIHRDPQVYKMVQQYSHFRHNTLPKGLSPPIIF